MIDIETITQIANNINEAKDALLLAKEDRTDLVEELVTTVLNEEEIEPELVDKLRVIEHEIDLANESIEANKNMLIAIIDGEDLTEEGEE
jgi:BioD-like phosphotransacetylase family protein